LGQPGKAVRDLFDALTQSASNAKLVSLGKLAILPLSLHSHPKAEFMLMNRALERGLVEFGELESSDVNRIRVTNRAKIPVLVLPGMVLEGAWQDRTATRPFVIPAGYSGPIPVFCVERRRWGGGRRFSRIAGSLDSLMLSKFKAMKAKQEEVWEGIHRRMLRSQIASSTESYRDLLSGREHRMLAERLAERVRLPREANGFVLFLDGKLIALELLPTHEAAAQTFTERLKATAVNLVDLETLHELNRGGAAKKARETDGRAGELRAKLSELLSRTSKGEQELEESEVGNLTKLRSERGDYAEVVVWQGMPLYLYATSKEAVELEEDLNRRYSYLLERYAIDLERHRQNLIQAIEELSILSDRSRDVLTREELIEIIGAMERLHSALRRLERRSEAAGKPIHPERLAEVRRRVIERLVEQVEQVA